MNLSWIDWTIVFGLLGFLMILAAYARKYTNSVVNFLAAGRCAGRYVIAVAEGISGWGAISAVAAFEMYYHSGFSIQWWYFITLMAYIIMSMSGWISYRFRQTRSLTMAQYLEKRYSRRFRIFAGTLAWVSGVMNFGLFPAVGARFFLHFCGFPETVEFAGLHISTYVLIIAFLLSVSLYIVFVGGQIAVIVTDFAQGLFCNIVFVILIGVLLFGIFNWSQITGALQMAPPDQSLIDPFKTSQTKDFNVWYYILFAIGMFYSWMSWQQSQGYRTAAKTPHEARMALIVSNWRSIAQQLVIIIIPVCAYTLMHHPSFAAQAQIAKDAISKIAGRTPSETATLQRQLTTTVAMTVYLKTGLMGAVCAVMLAAFISTHDTFLHSWGSIFIQDVVMPLRKKPLTTRQHINLLRISILGVAVFVFLFSLFYRQNEYILMFMAFTGTIFIGGAGAVVIGGLYWKRGTTAAAWCSLILGMTMAFAGAITRRLWPDFPINSQWIGFITSIACSTVYIVVSLFGKKTVDMDKMLLRGKYARQDDAAVIKDEPVRGFRALIAMGNEFSRFDKFIYIATLSWSLSLCVVFIVGVVYNLIFDVKVESWIEFWWVYVLIYFVLSIVTTIWFTIGGLRDYRDMFRLLKIRKSDETDDGRVLD